MLDWSKHRGQQSLVSRSEKLNDEGLYDVSVKLEPGWAASTRQLVLSAEVIDANRQSVASSATALLHPAELQPVSPKLGPMPKAAKVAREPGRTTDPCSCSLQ